MQKEIKTPHPLLNENGLLLESGYALHPIFDYDRSKIAAPSWRIKEWDYYAILNDDYGFTVTFADLSYSALITIVWLDFKEAKIRKFSKLLWFTFGKLNLPSSSLQGDIHYHQKGINIDFLRTPQGRQLKIHLDEFEKAVPLSAEFFLEDKKDESMVIMTPWKENPKAFYYNQKVNCMPASGSVTIGEMSEDFKPNKSFAVLDWGRGVWTYKNTWYWSSLNIAQDGHRIGFNLGYGFGDTSAASENMIFVDGKAHKLDQVVFEFDPKNLMHDWHFKDNQNRLDLQFEPVLDRKDDINFIVIQNLGDQIFGRFTGTMVLDDGATITLQGAIGFLEKITNHY